jgi:peroxiredoxin
MIHDSRRKISFFIVCAVFLAGLNVLQGQGGSKGVRPAPDFVLPTIDGKILKSASLKGRVIVLDFFQTWCPDCQQTSPELEKLYKRYKNLGLVVVGISHDKEGAKAVEPFVKKYGLTYPVLIGDISIAVSYIGVTPEKPSFRIPYVILIDRKGNIVGEYEEGTHKEAMDIKLLEERIKKLL